MNSGILLKNFKQVLWGKSHKVFYFSGAHSEFEEALEIVLLLIFSESNSVH